MGAGAVSSSASVRVSRATATARGSSGQQVAQVGAQDRGARRLEADDRDAVDRERTEHAEQVGQLLLRAVQLPGADPGEAAARVVLGDQHLVPGVDEHRDGGLRHGRREGVGERVGPEHHLRPARTGRPAVLRALAGTPEEPVAGTRTCADLALGVVPTLAPAAGADQRHALAPRAAHPGAERPARERDHLPPGVHAAAGQHHLGDRPDAEHRVDQRGQPGDAGDQPRPAGQPAEGVVRRRTQLAAVRTVQHLRLVLRHVDAGRAVRRARLAGQAEVERLVHLGRRPAAADERAVRHLLQHARAAAGRVLLVPRRQVGRAHEAAGRGAVRAALADADAAVQRGGQVARRRARTRTRAVGQQRAGVRAAQVGVERARPDQHAGVEQVARVEQVLERAEQVDRLRGVHDRQQLRAGAAVAVLAGQRPAVRTRRGAAASVMNARSGLPDRSSGMSRRRCTQPSPKCPYARPSTACDAMSASSSRRYAPSRSGGTAESSNPGHACSPDGVRPPRPAPSSRIRHIAAASGPGGKRPTARRCRRRPRARAPGPAPRSGPSRRPRPSATRRPSGSGGTAAAPRTRRTTSTSRESMPSMASGACASSAGTASAAVGMSG